MHQRDRPRTCGCRHLPVRAGLAALIATVIGAGGPAHAQGRWNDSTVIALVQRGIELRARQLADTGLVDYRARAHGYVAFLAQLGDEAPAGGAPASTRFTDPPRVVKADELALDVFWKAPNRSKQRIVGRRDTLLLPTDINYHRDHLGIVQHNFPSIIRLGEGDEVRDVVHPLAAAGRTIYDFAITDSLEIRLPDRAIQVYEVKVRPRNDRVAAIIGALYLERQSGQIVRMAFGFTRAAFRDEQLEDLSIVLDNALIEGRFWLPRHQEIEIRRSGTWMRFPARGIIRGRWQICCYEVNQELPESLFQGDEIVLAPASVRERHQWSGTILDSLPSDVRAVTAEEVARVHDEARELVRAEALAQTRGSWLAAGSASDLIRVNRVEGVSLGAGFEAGIGGGFRLSVRGRYGVEDERAKGEVGIGYYRASGAGIRLLARDILREAGDIPEGSGLRNSVAAQEFGSDYTDPYRVKAVGLAVDFPSGSGDRQTLELTWERQHPVAVNATPSTGRYEPTIPALPVRALRVSGRVRSPPRIAGAGWQTRTSGELRLSRWWALGDDEEAGTVLRAWLAAETERTFAGGRLVLSGSAMRLSEHGSAAPVQEYGFAGGPVTGPGYRFHQFIADRLATVHIEWRQRIPFAPVPLGRFGRAPPAAQLAPYLHLVGARLPGERDELYPSAGAALLMLFDAIRVDVARGFRDGRWSFNVDLVRDFWGIL